MMKRAFVSALLLAAASLPAFGQSGAKLHEYIRPFVGTKGEGNTYPGPSAPFGMMQLSAPTRTTNFGTRPRVTNTPTPSIMGF